MIIVLIIITVAAIRNVIIPMILSCEVCANLGCGKNGVNANGAAAEVRNFDTLGKKVRPGIFGEDKSRLTGIPRKPLCPKKMKIAVTPLVLIIIITIMIIIIAIIKKIMIITIIMTNNNNNTSYNSDNNNMI